MLSIARVVFPIVFLVAFASQLTAAEGDEDWVCLFNGRDLSAWKMGPEKSWVIADGVITLKREFDGREHNLDYLWTKETFGDFVLELEFKVPERANSGVFIRTPDLRDPVFTGIEVQVANSYRRDRITRGGTAGAIYDLLAPTKNTIKPPGEWNKYRISCKKNLITVALNGEQIIEMDLDRWTETGKNPDGSPNKFTQPLKDFARVGHIGLQDHGRAVWYRNIRVKRLE